MHRGQSAYQVIISSAIRLNQRDVSFGSTKCAAPINRRRTIYDESPVISVIFHNFVIRVRQAVLSKLKLEANLIR